MPLRSIMIIDDNEVKRYLLGRYLKKAKIEAEIFEAENGQFALDFLSDYDKNTQQHPETFPPDIIFLDINMPIMGALSF